METGKRDHRFGVSEKENGRPFQGQEKKALQDAQKKKNVDKPKNREVKNSL